MSDFTVSKWIYSMYTYTCTVNENGRKWPKNCFCSFVNCGAAINQWSFASPCHSHLLWICGKPLETASWNTLYSTWLISVYQAPVLEIVTLLVGTWMPPQTHITMFSIFITAIYCRDIRIEGSELACQHVLISHHSNCFHVEIKDTTWIHKFQWFFLFLWDHSNSLLCLDFAY